MAKKSQNLGTAILWLQANSKGLEAALKRMEKRINQFSRKWARSLKATGRALSTAGASLTRLGLMGAAAFGTLFVAIKKTTDAFAVQELAEAQLAATLESTGHAAGLTADQLTGMASALQDVTRFGDEAIIGAESLLLTFKNIKTGAFEPALETILDMSTAMKTDLKSSAILVGKALNDPIRGLSQLNRVGITFSKDQIEVIKRLSETGKAAEAQALIIEELQSQFGGSARAAAETLAGQGEQLSNIWGDLLEDLGQRFAPAVGMLFAQLKPVIGQFREWITNNKELGPAIENFAANVIPSLINVIKSLWNTFGPLLKAVGSFIVRSPELAAKLTVLALSFTALTLTLGPILFGLGQIFTSVGSLIGLAPKLLGVFKFAFFGMGAALALLAVPVAAFFQMWSSGDWTKNFLTNWVEGLVGGRKVFDSFFEGIRDFWVVDLPGWVSGAWGKVADTFVALGDGLVVVWDGVMGTIGSAWDAVTDGFIIAWDGVMGSMGSAWDAVTDGFIIAWGAVVDALKMAANIVLAPLAAVVSMLNSIISTINQMDISVPDWVPGIGGKGFNFDFPLIPMPQFATGGVMPATGLALVGERGPEIVLMPGGAEVFPRGEGPSTAVALGVDGVPGAPAAPGVAGAAGAPAAPGVAGAAAGLTINGPLIGQVIVREEMDFREVSVRLAREFKSEMRKQGLLV